MKKDINSVLGTLLLLVALVIAVAVIMLASPQVASYVNVQEVNAQDNTERLTGWMWNGAYECSTFSESLDECEGEPANVGLGWISLNCENHGCSTSDYGVEVEIDSGDISGYAWASGYGWISFNETGDGPDGSDADMWVVNDRIVGWAKVLSMGDEGWIKFDEVPYDEGEIGDSGWAWHAVPDATPIDDKWGFGWLRFIDAEGPVLEVVPPVVDLVAEPDFSASAFSPDLIATVLEGNGPFEYSFKCDWNGQCDDIDDDEWDEVADSSNDEYTYDGCTYGSDGESGTWNAWVRVEDGSRQQGCASARVTVCTPDDPACNLIGCYAEADAYDDGTSAQVRLDENDSVTIGTPVTWIVELRSTADPITSGFSWLWDPPIPDWEDDDGSEVEVVYETVGIKRGSVEIGGNEESCGGFRVIVDPEFEEF